MEHYKLLNSMQCFMKVIIDFYIICNYILNKLILFKYLMLVQIFIN